MAGRASCERDLRPGLKPVRCAPRYLHAAAENFSLNGRKLALPSISFTTDRPQRDIYWSDVTWPLRTHCTYMSARLQIQMSCAVPSKEE